MKEKCDFYKKEKLIAKRVKYCRSLRSRILGLMFVHGPGNGALLPDVNAIHMNFVRFNLRIVWLDKDFTVLDQITARKWRLYNGPEGARHVLELPADKKYDIKNGDKLRIKIYEDKK